MEKEAKCWRWLAALCAVFGVFGLVAMSIAVNKNKTDVKSWLIFGWLTIPLLTFNAVFG